MRILLLCESNRHAEHVERSLTFDRKRVDLQHPQDVHHLVRQHTDYDLIIESGQWWVTKSQEFMDRVELIKRHLLQNK